MLYKHLCVQCFHLDGESGISNSKINTKMYPIQIIVLWQIYWLNLINEHQLYLIKYTLIWNWSYKIRERAMKKKSKEQWLNDAYTHTYTHTLGHRHTRVCCDEKPILLPHLISINSFAICGCGSLWVKRGKTLDIGQFETRLTDEIRRQFVSHMHVPSMWLTTVEHIAFNVIYILLYIYGNKQSSQFGKLGLRYSLDINFQNGELEKDSHWGMGQKNLIKNGRADKKSAKKIPALTKTQSRESI